MAFSPALLEYLHTLDKDQPLLVLLDIVAGGETLRLAANNEDVTYQGNTYVAFSFEVDKPGADGKGGITTLPLRICNVERVLRPYLDAYDGGVGLPVTITIINPALDDGEQSEELSATLYNLSTDADDSWVNFTLGPINPLNKAFPPDQYIALHCRWNFSADPRCGYTGPATECERSLTACRALGNSRRFGGFPGLDGRPLRVI